ncbi:MAG: glucose-6-phosphate isomerase family protein [Candidatus Staskawiczbacteria bacterium]|jgi:glucose-6-phosphate isomerase
MEIDFSDKKPDIRYLDDMRMVLSDKEWAKTAPNLELYNMYRSLETKDGVRYDITVIPPAMLGDEFVKTKGHEHLNNRGEIYIVLEGQAIYLMQRRTEDHVDDAYAVKAKKGDVVIIPPLYGHTTINPSNETLKMGNWIASECKNYFAFFEKMQGACYYYTKNGWVKNEAYKDAPALRYEEPSKSLPEDLNFLK